MEKKDKTAVLFVCLGNICRSPAGEAIFKKRVQEKGLEDSFVIDSAGTSGWHTNELPDRRMRAHGERRGYVLDSRSRKFLAEDFDRFDIILAMDDNNYYDILKLAPDLDAEKKVFRMVDFLQRLTHDHIPDPYYSGAEGFELVLDLLEDACEGLLKHTQNGR